MATDRPGQWPCFEDPGSEEGKLALADDLPTTSRPSPPLPPRSRPPPTHSGDTNTFRQRHRYRDTHKETLMVRVERSRENTGRSQKSRQVTQAARVSREPVGATDAHGVRQRRGGRGRREGTGAARRSKDPRHAQNRGTGAHSTLTHTQSQAHRHPETRRRPSWAPSGSRTADRARVGDRPEQAHRQARAPDLFVRRQDRRRASDGATDSERARRRGGPETASPAPPPRPAPLPSEDVRTPAPP